MANRTAKLLVAVGMPLLLAACAGAQRFDGLTVGSRPLGNPAPTAPAPDLPAAEPIQTAPVTSAPLPPPPGAAMSVPPAAATPPGAATPAPADPFFQPTAPATPPPAPRTIETPTMQGGATDVATLGAANAQPASSRDSVIGGWTAREATGGSCRVTLSSSPALDLYRASTQGCANRELQKVNAWDFRDGEVFLYQPGGGVAARLRASNRSAMSGVIARSGAGLTMAR